MAATVCTPGGSSYGDLQVSSFTKSITRHFYDVIRTALEDMLAPSKLLSRGSDSSFWVLVGYNFTFL